MTTPRWTFHFTPTSASWLNEDRMDGLAGGNFALDGVEETDELMSPVAGSNPTLLDHGYGVDLDFDPVEPGLNGRPGRQLTSEGRAVGSVEAREVADIREVTGAFHDMVEVAAGRQQ
jgi:hypothetical protein